MAWRTAIAAYIKNDDTKNNQGETSDRAKGSNKKASGETRKWSPLRHWRQAPWPKRFGWIAALITVVGVPIWDHCQRGHQFSTEHRPRIEFFREPALVGKFTCSVDQERSINFSFGMTYIWLKNVRNGDAIKVYVAGPWIRPVADPPSTNQDFNTVQPVTEESCRVAPPPQMAMLSLNAGRETMLQRVQSSGGMSVDPNTKITPETTFQLAGPLCVYYSDEEGGQHGTCVTYRLVRDGNYRFSCKDSPTTGTFQQMLFGSCEN